MDGLRERISRLEHLILSHQSDESRHTSSLAAQVADLRASVHKLPLGNAVEQHEQQVRHLELFERVLMLSRRDSDERRDHIKKSDALRCSDVSTVASTLAGLQQIEARLQSLEAVPAKGVDALDRAIASGARQRARADRLRALEQRVARMEDDCSEFVGRVFETLVL